ncbi:MAG TPA: glycerate kinase [Actinomycetales bacterium]|nr:glycerate kinase [Actinomycetales bacterium]
MKPVVVVAPDKFKGTLTASQVADHLTQGITDERPDVCIRRVPVADGGEGTVDAATHAGFSAVALDVVGPTGEPVRARYARRGDDAVVELAEASGLTLLPHGPARSTALRATSYGTGQLLAAALDAGCRRIVLGIGGSACTDGGAGMLQALGARITDSRGRPVGPGGQGLLDAPHLDLARLPDLSGIDLVVACDVDNPLLGPRGAAAVYGPQKGADDAGITALDAALERWSRLVTQSMGEDHTRDPGAGAAGGVGFAALAVLGARMRPGAEVMLELSGLREALNGATLLVTGEGRLDLQTLHGKAPAAVAAAGREAGVPVVGVVGSCALTEPQVHEIGLVGVHALTDEPDVRGEPELAMRRPGPLLVRIGAAIARRYLPASGERGGLN